MIFALSTTQSQIISKTLETAVPELNQFFKLKKPPHPPVFLLPDRQTINNLMGFKTEDWMVGWGRGDVIYLLKPDRLESESSHFYSDHYYASLIKHELCHCFLDKVTHRANKPSWLIEGLCVYLSGQNSLKAKPQEFSTFLDFYNGAGKGVYTEGGFAVDWLIKKYGKRRLIKLLKALAEIKNQKAFNQKFKQIYSFSPKYCNFNNCRI